MTTLGERLSAAMREENITASELARQLKVSRAAVSLWVHDKASMSTDNAIQVAHILNTSPQWLLSGEMKTPNGEWLELTPMEFEIIRTIRKYGQPQNQSVG